jgi:hypothetical protein
MRTSWPASTHSFANVDPIIPAPTIPIRMVVTYRTLVQDAIVAIRPLEQTPRVGRSRRFRAATRTPAAFLATFADFLDVVRTIVFTPELRRARRCVARCATWWHMAVSINRAPARARRPINGLPGLIAYSPDGHVETVAFEIEDDRIRTIYSVRNPDKLKHLTPA